MGIQNCEIVAGMGIHPCPSSAGQVNWGCVLPQGYPKGWFVPLGETCSICASQAKHP